MTTQITIQAHCHETKHVVCTEKIGPDEIQTILEDGEQRIFYVYDEKSLTVKEMLKSEG